MEVAAPAAVVARTAAARRGSIRGGGGEALLPLVTRRVMSFSRMATTAAMVAWAAFEGGLVERRGGESEEEVGEGVAFGDGAWPL